MKVHTERMEIEAWKGWTWKRTEGRVFLASPSMNTVWEGPVLRAHDTPTKEDSCGIYALKEMPKVGEPNFHYCEQVYGKVALSGTVIEHETGYRAQVATIREVWVRELPSGVLKPNECWCSFLRSLEQQYGAEVHGDFPTAPHTSQLLDLDAGESVEIRIQGLTVRMMMKAVTVRHTGGGGPTEIEVDLRGYQL